MRIVIRSDSPSPDGPEISGESPEFKKVVFADGKTRPQEALFMALKKHLFERGLVMHSRNNCQMR